MKKPRIVSDEKGAVMIMAAFLLLLMTALLYYVHGIGQAAMERIAVQDAADATAYSVAVVKAKGMNLIAMINLVMAAVLAVLVALRLVEAVIYVVIAALTVACIFSPPACAPIPVLVNLAVQYSQKVSDFSDQVDNVLKGLERAGTGINRFMPLMAQAEGVYISTRPCYDPAHFGFTWPLADELPTRLKPGGFGLLCKKAGENVGEISTAFFPPGVRDVAKKAMGGLASTFSSFFCGGGSRPDEKRKIKKGHPVDDDKRCRDPASQPHPVSGVCKSSRCTACARKACRICTRYGDDAKEIRVLRHVIEFRQDIHRDGTVGVYIDDEFEESAVLDSMPCSDPVCPGSAGAFGKHNICSENKVLDKVDLPNGTRLTRNRLYHYREILGCVTEEEIKVEAKGDSVDSNALPRELVDDWRKNSQVRSIVIGGSGAGKRTERVGVALDGPMGGPVAAAGKMAIAQAEFTSPSQDMWTMDWYARLVRFRFEPGGGLGDCRGSAMPDECEDVSGWLTGGLFKGIEKAADQMLLH